MSNVSDSFDSENFLKIPKGVTRNPKSKEDGQYNGQKKSTKGQTTNYKTYI